MPPDATDVDDAGVAPIALASVENPPSVAGRAAAAAAAGAPRPAAPPASPAANVAIAGAVPSDPRAAIVVRDQKISQLAQGIADQPALAPPPTAPKIGAPPAYQETSPFEAFGSVASAFGALASLTTRRPLVGALNAISGAMEATYTHDYTSWKRNYDAWKQNMDAVYKDFNAQMKSYDAALAGRKQTNEQTVSIISAIAHMNQDSATLAHLQQGDAQIAQRFLIARERIAAETQRHALDLDRHNRDYWSDPWHLYLAGQMDIYKQQHNGQMPSDPNVILQWKENFTKASHVAPRMTPQQMIFEQGYREETEQKGRRLNFEELVDLAQRSRPLSEPQQLHRNEYVAAIRDVDQSLEMIGKQIEGGTPVTGLYGKFTQLLGAAQGYTGSNLGMRPVDPTTARYEESVNALLIMVPKLLGATSGHMTASARDALEKTVAGLRNARGPEQIEQEMLGLREKLVGILGHDPVTGIAPYKPPIIRAPAPGAAPAAPASPMVPAPRAQPTMTEPPAGTSGSKEAPMDVSGPNGRALFNSLPIGTYFINPSDNKVYQKTKQNG